MEIEITNVERSFYIAVILYESSSNAPGYKPLYQESFVLFEATSPEEAQARALVFGNQQQVSYKNENHETIIWSLKQVVDVNSILYDELEDGSELYARHFRNYEAYCAFEPLLSGEL